MKQYAQVGFALGDKVNAGLQTKIINGAIFSPKDMTIDSLRSKMEAVGRAGGEVYFDPQYYVSLYANSPNARLGKLTELPYFTPARKGQLEVGKNIDEVLSNVLKIQASLPVSAFIAPNIYISKSFDSREAVIAKNFIRQARAQYNQLSNDKPLYVSLVICREALMDQREFEEFVNDITLLDEPPDGFYILIGSRFPDAREEIYNADVIANWMFLNYSFNLNGYRTINGYSDLLSPFLGAVGADVGATGWFSNLRAFSLDRFIPPGTGGRLPVIRYLSKLLLNRITCSEKEAFAAFVPSVINALTFDEEYNPEPERAREVLQSWEAIQSLNLEVSGLKEIGEKLTWCDNAIINAMNTYATISNHLSIERKSNGEHLESLQDGILKFRKLAEL